MITRRKRKTPPDYSALAQKRGITWLGPEVPNITTKTCWRCEKGHTFQSTYACTKNGKADCPKCYMVSKRKQPADYHDLAKERGFEWLGPETINAEQDTGWQCPNGHAWQANYRNIKDGRLCPKCLKQRRKTPAKNIGGSRKKTTPADYHDLAKERGFEWLGPPAQNVGKKTNWQCSKGHRWPATYQNIRIGSGCPDCSGRKKKGKLVIATKKPKQRAKPMGAIPKTRVTVEKREPKPESKPKHGRIGVMTTIEQFRESRLRLKRDARMAAELESGLAAEFGLDGKMADEDIL